MADTVGSEDDVIRKRLLFEAEGTSGDDRRINSLLKTFMRWCNAKDSGTEESETTYQKMLFTLSQVEFSFEKTQLVMEMNRLEMMRYKELCHEIEEQIGTAQKSIATYKEEFTNAKEIRQHRQEYDLLAKVIQQQPNRQETEKQIDNLQQKLKQLEATKKELHSKLDLRKKQFHLLVHSIHGLQQLLQDEEGTTKSDDTQMDTT
ncbi:THO complex subunit 7 homolog [Dysidea avara]|uniref:THO complex subunit 7 homolog n=1 Tax=Dysidea avara TaxID=196820 RepID=UPI00332C507E